MTNPSNIDVALKIACCKRVNSQNCKYPKCNVALNRIVKNNKNTIFKCSSCDFSFDCSDVGKTIENPPPSQSPF